MMNQNPPKMVIVVRKDLNMRKGKMCAQCGHAASYFLTSGTVHPFKGKNEFTVRLSDVELEWIVGSHAKVVVSCDSEQELRELMQKARASGIRVHEVIDAGKTEFHGEPTLTCAAFGPDNPNKLDKITGELKLL